MERMNFDLAELQAFVAVAERQSFRAAAEALHLSQPALSRRIDKLEAALGTALLARATRRVALTATGRDFLAPARLALGSLPVLPAGYQFQVEVDQAGPTHYVNLVVIPEPGAALLVAVALAGLARLHVRRRR